MFESKAYLDILYGLLDALILGNIQKKLKSWPYFLVKRFRCSSLFNVEIGLFLNLSSGFKQLIASSTQRPTIL